MTPADLDHVIAEFWQARQAGVYFPPAWCGRLSLDEGYRVQLGLLDRLVAAGERQVGWKVGLTASAIQRQFNVHEPVFGYLLAGGVYTSPARFVTTDLIRPGFEPELCVMLATDLADAPATSGDARSAIAAVQPALEITETRGDLSAYLSVALAENVQQKAIVLGSPWQPPADAWDLAAVRVRLALNGEQVDEGTGAAVLGDPLRSVAWLAAKLATLGRKLEAGQIVMTGSFTRQYPASAGLHVQAAFNLGAVEASFV